MPVCGPKLSLCGVILSAWAILQLSIMGVFFYVNSVALIEDITLKDAYTSMEELRKDMDDGYRQNALNCWIAALLYLGVMVFSGHQFWANNRA